MVRSALKMMSAGAALMALFFGVVGLSISVGTAGEREMYTQLARPPDIATERLERPRPEPDRLSSGRPKANLRQAEVIALAKAAATKELGQSFDGFELKAVVFDPTAKIWSVTFDPKPPRRSSEACVIVLVRDDTKDTDLSRCS